MNLHDAAAAFLSYALQSGLLLMVGLLLPRALRLRHPAVLLGYWRVLLAAVLLLPLAMTAWHRQTPLPMLEIDGMAVDAIVATTLPDAIPGLTWRSALFVAIGVALLALFRLLVGLAYLHRCRRAATRLAPLPFPVAVMQERLGMKVPFFISDRLTVPITFGWWRPVVLVPRAFERMSPEQQEGVACHELLHVQRRDWPMTVLEEGLRAALWFHPGVWVLLSKITLAREQVVDAGAVRLTEKRRQYLDALWQIVCTYRRPTVAPAVPLLGRHHLVERVELLKKEISMSKLQIVVTGTVLVVALASFGFLGASVFAAGADATNYLSSQPKSDQKSEKEDNDKVTPIKGECDDITDPVAVEKTSPKYPEEARKAKITGLVIVTAVINHEGVVEDIEIRESPDALLSEAAIEAIRTWRFEPALCDGNPVGVWYDITVKFALK